MLHSTEREPSPLHRAAAPRGTVSLAGLPGSLFELASAAAQGHGGLSARRVDKAPSAQPWLVCMLDEVDYGMLLVRPDGSVLHANKAARRDLHTGHALLLDTARLQARRPQDHGALHEALALAAHRGLRRLLTLGSDVQRCTVAVVPLAADMAPPERAVLVMLGKRQVCEELSVEGFARSQGLTLAETQVLKALCSGSPPLDIARGHGVALSTVRTQIGSIRAKTGTGSIRALVQMVAQLPPLVGALGAGHGGAGAAVPA